MDLRHERTSQSMNVKPSSSPAVFFGVVVAALLLLLVPSCKKEGPFEQGANALKKGDYDQAIGFFSEALQLDPKNVEAHLDRGIAYDQKGDHDKAIADYSEVLMLDPNHAPAFYRRGVDHESKGDHDRAIDDFSNAVRINPKYAKAHINRGLAYQARGDYARAMEDYSEEITLDPKDAAAYAALGSLFATCPKSEIRDGQKAFENARKACELTNWKDPRNVDILASAYAESGDFAQAIRWEKEYLETTKLNDKDATAAHQRLALYEAHKPYHAER